MHKRMPVFAFAIGFVLLLLAGCQHSGSTSAEQAAVQQLLNQVSVGVIDPNSVAVLQTQAFEETTFVVLAYHRVREDHDEQCLAMVETHQAFFTGWVAGSGAGSCTDRRPENTASLEPMRLSGGSRSRADQKKEPISHIIGQVNDPAIEKVRILWKDGHTQEAQLINNTFLVVRAGQVDLQTAEGLNAENTILTVINQ